MASAEGEFPKVGNDPLFNSEVNSFGGQVQQIYIGSGFDSNRTNAGTTTGSFEVNLISAGSINNAGHLIFDINGLSIIDRNGVARADHEVRMKVQTKESGGTYSDSTGYQVLIKTLETTEGVYQTSNWTWAHALTGSEKTFGVQAIIFSQGFVDNNGAGTSGTVASFTNAQSVLGLN